jgi:hypothetical protein
MIGKDYDVTSKEDRFRVLGEKEETIWTPGRRSKKELEKWNQEELHNAY